MATSFQLLECIGEGGFGKVYRARMHGPDGVQKDVALKLIRPEQASDAVLDRLREEARLLGLIHHEGVVRVEPPLHLRDGWAVVMELVEGPSLDQAVRAGLPEGARLEVVAEVARVLDALHRATDPEGRPLDLLHRDVKPQNVMIAATGDVKLLDFGIAGSADGEGASLRELGGTPGFVAPERLVGREVPAGDVFSLGRTLAVAFEDRQLQATTVLDAASALEPLEALRPEAPPRLAGVQALAEAMLVYDPEARPALAEVERRARDLAAELGGPDLRTWAEAHARDLRRRLPDDSRVGRRLGDGPPPARWPWAVLALVALVGAGLLLWQRQQARTVWLEAVQVEREAGLFELREGAVPAGQQLWLRDLVVTSVQEDRFTAGLRVGKFGWLSGLEVAAPPDGLSVGDLVDVQGVAEGIGLKEARWVRTGSTEPLPPQRVEDGRVGEAPAWQDVLVAVTDVTVLGLEGEEARVGRQLLVAAPEPLAPGEQLHLVVGIGERRGEQLVLHPRGPEDLLRAPPALDVRALRRDGRTPLDHPATVTSVVRAVQPSGHAFTLQDPEGGPSSGLLVWTRGRDVSHVAVGQRVRITAPLQHFVPRDLPRQTPPVLELTLDQQTDGVLDILGPGELPEPPVLTAAQVASFPAARPWGGMLVRVDGLSQDPVVARAEGGHGWVLASGLRIGNRLSPDDPRLAEGVRLRAVTGLVDLAYGQRTLQPRGPEDLLLAE